MHTKGMRNSEGDFSIWKKSSSTCPRCDKVNGVFRVWESSCGAYEDYEHVCNECGHGWWIDGIDS